VCEVRPTQVTLVPDSPEARTSDHGWQVAPNAASLAPVVRDFRALGIRVSLFMDFDSDEWTRVRDLGADRVELYTEPYAAATAGRRAGMLDAYRAAAACAQAAGLGVNAGHDLNLRNLGAFCRIPNILELSIGHALIADALERGLAGSVQAYLAVLAGSAVNGEAT
jgi:pyridoxine 5-phosphate synthase